MANNGNITFGIGFNVDKSGLNDLKKSLQDIQKATTKDLVGDLGGKNAQEALDKVKKSASQIQQALQKAYNPTVNSINVAKFNQQLSKTGTNLNTVYQDFAKLGPTGQAAFTRLASNILTTNVQLKETHSLLDSMGQTMMNTVKWGIASSVMNTFTGSIQNAYNYVKVLDSSLTDIRIVTGQSREEMDKFAESANRAAQNLGRQTKDYTNAALSFYQQGLSDDEVAARTETTLKAANITGAGVSDMADQLTAVWNGFQVGIEDTENVVSKLAAVADSSASNMSELATAMSKTASVANNMGVDVDQLTAQVSTIIATTRQAPQTVGNALKTIYARINDIKAGSDEAEISLGNYTGKMAALGIQVLDQQGNLRDTGQVMEEIGQRWGTMTREQQIYLAQTMAGQRQMNNLIALFDNWDMYTKELNTSLEAQGTLDQKNARYMESLAAHVNQLTAASEGLIQSLVNGDSFKGFIDAGTVALKLLTDLVDSIGGGGTAIAALGSIATSVFGNVISKEINSLVTNFQNAAYNAEQLRQVIQNTKAVAAIEGIQGSAVEAMVKNQTEIQKYYSVMSEAEINHQNELIKELGLAQQEYTVWDNNTKKAQEYAKTIMDSQAADIFTKDQVAAWDLQQQIDKVDKSAEKLKRTYDSFKAVDWKTIGGAKQINALKEDVQNLISTSHLTGPAVKQVQDSLAFLGQTGQATEQDIKKLKIAIQDLLAETNNNQSTLKDSLNQDAQAVQALKQKIQILQKTIENNKNNAKQLFDIQNIVKSVAAIGQLTSAINMLSNLPTIWSDEKLSSVEKFRQTILNVASAFPMLVASYTQLNNVFKINQSLQAIGIALNKKRREQIVQEITLEKGLQAAHQAGHYLKVQNIADLKAQQAEHIKQVYAKQMDIEKTREQITANYALQASFGVLFIAITAAVGAFTLISSHMQEVRKAAMQANQAVIDQAKASQEQVDSNKKLYDSFNDLLSQYEKGLIAKQDLYQITDSLSQAYGIEGSALAQLSGEYDRYAKAVEKARKEQLEQQIQKNRLAITNSTQQMVQAAREGSGRKVGNNYYFSPTPGVGLFGAGYNISQADQQAAQIYSQTTGAKYIPSRYNPGSFMPSAATFQNLSVDFTKPNEIIDYYQTLQKTLEKLNQESLTGTNIYQDIQKQLGQMAEAYNSASQAIRANQQNILELASIQAGLVKADTQEGFEEAIAQIRRRVTDAADEGLIRSDTDIEGLIESFVRKLNNSFAREYLANTTIQAIEQIPETVKQAFEDLPTQKKSLLLQAGFTFDQNTTEQQVEAAALAATAKTGYAEIPAQLVVSASSNILKGKQLDKDTFDALKNSFSPELAAQMGERQEFNNKTIADRIDLLNRLTSAQMENNRAVLQNADAISTANKEAQAQYDALLDSVTDQLSSLYSLRETLEKSGQTESDAFARASEKIAILQEQLQQLRSGKYVIDVSVNLEDVALAELNTSIGKVITDAERLQTAAYLVGQSWTVAAENVGQFASLFPQLMQDAQRFADGSIGLDKERVASVLGTNAEIINSNKQVVIQAIDDKIAQLKAENEFQLKKMEILQALLDGTTTEEEAERDLKKITVDYKNKMQELGVQVNGEAVNQLLDNAKIGQAGILQTLLAVQNAIAQINEDYSKMLSDQAVPKRTGFSGSGTVARAETGWTASKGADDIPAGSDIQDADVRAAIKQQIEQAKAVVEANNSAIASYQGLRSQILATSKEAVEASDRVQQGLAGAPSKDKTSSKKSGGGGSKKGSGSSAKDKTKSADQIEKKKLKDDQIDRYHELDRAIKDVQETIDDLNRAEGKTVRNGLSQTIDQQVAALEQQKGLYEQKLGLMQADLQMMQANLAALGVQFDEQGNIINYTSLMIEYQSLYNQLLEEAKLLTGDEQQAKLNEAEAVKAKLDSLRSQMGAYEQLQDKIVDAGNAIQDILDKEEELRIKQFKIKIDWQLDKAQAERDWNEFRKKVIDKIKDDDYLGQARARLQDFYSYYKPDGGGIIQELTEHVNRTRQEAEIIENGGVSSIYGKNQAQALEDLKHYTDELMQNLEDVQEIAKDIHDLYLDTIDKANDAFDEQIAAYEQIDSIIEHDLNLIQMLQPVDNEEQLERYYNLRRDNNNQQIDFYRKEVDMWKRQMDAAEEGTEEWKKFRDNWMESVNDLNSAVDTAVENLLDKYHNTIQKIIKDSKDQLMGGDWQKALDEWDRAKWFDDRYLDLGTRGTGVLDFVTDVNKAMQGLPAKQQQQLLKFMDSEVEKLNNLTKMRQIDLDIANKRLEVLQKQMALEDAQQNKTQLRLRRDSQGNYSYQYVADQDQVASKEQQLRDVLEELRQLAKQDMTQTIDEVESKVEEFYSRAQELTETYYYDQELLKQKLLELEEQYFGEQGYITMLGIDYNNMQSELIAATGAQFSELLRQEGDALAAFLGLDTDNAMENSIWQSILKLLGTEDGELPKLLDIFTSQVMQDNFNKMGQMNQDLLFGEGGMSPSWNTAIGNMAMSYVSLTNDVVIPSIAMMIQATDAYAQDLMILQQVAGISFSDISRGIDYTIGQTRALIQDNGTLINSFEQEINAVAQVCAQIAALCEQYRAAEAAAIAAADAAIKFWAAAQGVAADVSVPHSSYSGSSNGYTGASSSPSRSSSSGSSSGGSSGGGSTVTYSATIQKPGLSKSSSSGGVFVPGMGGRRAAIMATGGYTGEWANGDNEGRLAFLHQKELVLNAEDTKNILSAVDIVRKLTNQIAGLNGLAFSNLPSTNMNSVTNNDNGNKIEQSVVIHANFPDVSDAAQIKQAFDNLVNIAVMRANQR